VALARVDGNTPTMGPVRNTLRLIAPFAGAVVVAAILLSLVAGRTARAWFESELSTRARIAAHSARQAMLDAARDADSRRLSRLLSDVVRDDRVVAAALCSPDGRFLATSAEFPREAVPCRASADSAPTPELGLHSTVGVGGAGPTLQRSEFALLDGAELRARFIVLQDYGAVTEQTAAVQSWVLRVFALLAVASTALTLLATRLTSRGWGRRLADALRGAPAPTDGREPPLIEDVRAMAQRMSAALVEGRRAAPWTRERLRGILKDHLDDEEGLIVVANREPYIHHRADDGTVVVQHPASGLVSALEPVMRACSGIWVAHGGGSADRESADARGRLAVPPGEESYQLQRIWIDDAEEQGYYYGFANEGLWPLCHLAYARPIFRADDWAQYQKVNARFADAVVAAATVEDPIVLVQDYHFALVPRMIRQRLPRATIIAFWHIPWPNAERFGVCPRREEILDGLLGASIVGFHTQEHCHRFVDAVDAHIESRIERADHAVVRHGARTLVRAYPISIEWPSAWAARAPDAATCRREVLDELGLASDAILVVGVDRLDYTKGIEERLEAVEALLERRPDLRQRLTFVQLAAPSRTRISRYQELRDAVESVVSRINGRFATDGHQPVRLLRAHHEPERVFRFYRAADVCYVSSLHDGMNLVSKEFVGSRDDERGVLVLSRFAGAAGELSDALIVNPYDLEEMTDALERAIMMPASEQADRMRGLRAVVAERNVYRWAGTMLLDAAQVRHRARRRRRLESA
jgi:trehalose 6-phosphate synthase